MPNNIIRQDYGDVYSDKATQHMLAPIQTNLVAIKDYKKGENFIYGNELYKTTAAITAGTLMVIGTDAILASTLAEEIGNEIDKYNDILKYNRVTLTAINTNANVSLKVGFGFLHVTYAYINAGSYACTVKRTTSSNTYYHVPYADVDITTLLNVLPSSYATLINSFDIGEGIGVNSGFFWTADDFSSLTLNDMYLIKTSSTKMTLISSSTLLRSTTSGTIVTLPKQVIYIGIPFMENYAQDLPDPI